MRAAVVIQTKPGPRKWSKILLAELGRQQKQAEDLYAWARSKEVGGGA